MNTFVFLAGLGIETVALGFLCYLIYRDAKNPSQKSKRKACHKKVKHA